MKLEKNMFKSKPSPKDGRDFLAKSLLSNYSELKEEFFAGGKGGYHAYNQGGTSQCVGYGIAGLVQKLNYKETKEDIRFSPQFVYGNRFDTNDYLGEGYFIRKALSDLKSDGICKYDEFDNMVFTYKQAMTEFSNLPKEILESSKENKIDLYYRIDHSNPEEIISLLEKYNNPIVTGMFVYETMSDSYGDGIMKSNYKDIYKYGGHCTLICGYKKINDKYYYIMQNSWGVNVADKGYFYIPFDNDYIYEMWLALDYIKTEIRFKPNETTYYVNGESFKMDTIPVLRDDRTYVPLRFALENLNAEVIWDANTFKTRIVRGDDIYYFSLGYYNNSNGDKIYLKNVALQNHFDDSSFMKSVYYENTTERKSLTYHYLDGNDRIMIPVRKIFEHISNANVSWDSDFGEVVIRNY